MHSHHPPMHNPCHHSYPPHSMPPHQMPPYPFVPPPPPPPTHWHEGINPNNTERRRDSVHPQQQNEDEPDNEQEVDNGRRPAAQKLKELMLKQKVMEASVRRLLRSMNELRQRELEMGQSLELDKNRRMKMTRMVQILMLQRRNLQLQNETLRREVNTLSEKMTALRTKAEELVVANINISKSCAEATGDADRKAIQIENLLQNKVLLQKQVQDRIDMKVENENLRFEMRKYVTENASLVSQLRKIDSLLKNTIREKEKVETENLGLRNKVGKLGTNHSNLEVRFRDVSLENSRLKNECNANSNNAEDLELRVAENMRLELQRSTLEKQCAKLEDMYNKECHARRNMHTTMQTTFGAVCVYCRVKPSHNNPAFDFESYDKVISKASDNVKASGKQRLFTMNLVFRDNSTQQDVWSAMKTHVALISEGVSVCVLAFGPTGSGKSYTMQGTADNPGIIPRCAAQIFRQSRRSAMESNLEVAVSVVELYNEKICDLLSSNFTEIRIGDDGSRVQLHGVVEEAVTSASQLRTIISRGISRKRKAEIVGSVKSSRSHIITRIQYTANNNLTGVTKSATLILCDLAGSEPCDNDRNSKNNARVHQSLSALVEVFRNSSQRGSNVTFRNSKLTHILKPCLSGQARCVLLVTVENECDTAPRSIRALEVGEIAMQAALGTRASNELMMNSSTTRTRTSQDSR